MTLPVLLAGVAAFVAGIVIFVNALALLLGAPVFSTPGSEQVHCGTGTYVIYAKSNGLASQAGEVSVTSPSGATVRVSPDRQVETLTFDGSQFTGALQFDATKAGTYLVTIRSSGGPVAVTRSLSSLATANIGPIFLILAGFLTGVAGLILLVLGLVRRSRVARHPPGDGQPGGWASAGGSWQGSAQPGTAPPGWWPPPGQPQWPPPSVPPPPPAPPPPPGPASPGWPRPSR